MTLSGLGACLMHAQRFAEAEPFLQEAIAIKETVFGSDDSRLEAELLTLAELERRREYFRVAAAFGKPLPGASSVAFERPKRDATTRSTPTASRSTPWQASATPIIAGSSRYMPWGGC